MKFRLKIFNKLEHIEKTDARPVIFSLAMRVTFRKTDICGALRVSVSFVQFKKREKHPWRSVNFITKINTPPWVFFTLFKLHKWYQIAQRTTYI